MRNVVLCCLDSVRADTFAEYAPELVARAELSYTQCRAASSWSAPSYASMVTGQLASEHGVCSHDKSLEGVDRAETVFGDLDGHRALGVSTNVFAGSPFGFDRFFDSFVDVSETRRYAAGLDPTAFGSQYDSPARAGIAFLRAALRADATTKSLVNGALGFAQVASEGLPIPTLLDDGARPVVREARSLVDASPEPFVLFSSVMEAHTPLRHIRGFDRSLHDASNRFTTDRHSVWELLEAPEAYPAFLETRRGLYDASVDYLDRTLAPFVDWLVEETVHETTVVITADHGENQGYPYEEGHMRHKSSLSESLLHVPLVVVNPPEGYSERVTDYVSHLELPTLLAAFAREEVVDVTREQVVAEHVGMSAGPDPPDRKRYWDRLMRAAYADERKVVWDSLGDHGWYDLDHARPCWQEPLETTEPVPKWARQRFSEDAHVAKRRLRRAGSADDVGAGVQERLEKLGYA